MGYEDTSLGEHVFGSSNALSKPMGPSGEYCRICRATPDEDSRAQRALEGNPPQNELASGLRVALPRQNILGRVGKGGDLDIVAVPYVFRYLCAELAAMSVAVSLEVR